MKNIVPNDELCIILNDNSTYTFSYQIDKMGHIFNDDYLPAYWIENMIGYHGVKYMYSDSGKVDQDAEVQKYLDSLLLKAGSVHVYRLKELDPNKK